MELTRAKRAIQSQLAPLEREIAEMQQQIIEEMGLDGIDKITIDGLTLYMQAEFFARWKEHVDHGQAIDEMRKEGYADCLLLGHHRIRGLAREWHEQGRRVPEVIAKFCEIGSRTTLRARES